MSGTVTTSPGDLVRLGRALGARGRRNHPLGALTTYRVGGTAALFCEPADEAELVAVARAREGLDVPVLVIGRGSNLLVADAGFAGLAVRLGPGFESLDIDGTEVGAGGALSLPVLARRTAAAGLHGLEWAVGVPGSVGGAVRMNAGGHGSDTAATLVGFRWVDLATAEVHHDGPERLGFGYRHTLTAALPRSRILRPRMADVLRRRGINCVFGDILGVIPHPLKMPGDQQEIQKISDSFGKFHHPRGQMDRDLGVRFVEYFVVRLDGPGQFHIAIHEGPYAVLENPQRFVEQRLEVMHLPEGGGLVQSARAL